MVYRENASQVFVSYSPWLDDLTTVGELLGVCVLEFLKQPDEARGVVTRPDRWLLWLWRQNPHPVASEDRIHRQANPIKSRIRTIRPNGSSGFMCARRLLRKCPIR